MFEERALILERLGRHEQALSIYTSKLTDMDKALEYCKKTYEKNDPSRNGVSSLTFIRKDDWLTNTYTNIDAQVFTILMGMLLNPPTSLMPGVVMDAEEETKEPDLVSAVKLLHDFAPCIEPFRVSWY